MSRRYLRPGVLVGHVLVLAAALTCLRLGWWQWNVFEYARRGTVQNFGYALLWPVFSGAFIFMWLRFLHLESVRDGVPDAVDAADADEIAGEAAGLAFDVGGDGAAREVVTEASGDGAIGAEPSTSAAARTGDGGGGDGDDGDGAAAGAAQAAAGNDRHDVDDEAQRAGRRPRGRRGHPPPSTAYTIAVATVGDDDDDDPQLAAYNRALAALAEQDQRRAR